MAILALKGSGNFEQIVTYLESKISDSGLTNQLIHKVYRNVNGSRICLLAFEKYYIRNESRSSLTVLVTENDDEIIVDAIGTGGSKGVIFRISWGAEEDFVNLVKDLLVTKGFKQLLSDEDYL